MLKITTIVCVRQAYISVLFLYCVLTTESFKIALLWVVTPVLRHHKMCVTWSEYDAEYETGQLLYLTFLLEYRYLSI
jgi:hypothetical protein